MRSCVHLLSSSAFAETRIDASARRWTVLLVAGTMSSATQRRCKYDAAARYTPGECGQYWCSRMRYSEMENGGATLEKNRLPMAACWSVMSSALAPTTVRGSCGCASGDPIVMGGYKPDAVLSGEDRRRNILSSLFGVVGRDTGGVGGTSPVASAKLSNA